MHGPAGASDSFPAGRSCICGLSAREWSERRRGSIAARGLDEDRGTKLRACRIELAIEAADPAVDVQIEIWSRVQRR